MAARAAVPSCAAVTVVLSCAVPSAMDAEAVCAALGGRRCAAPARAAGARASLGGSHCAAPARAAVARAAVGGRRCAAAALASGERATVGGRRPCSSVAHAAVPPLRSPPPANPSMTNRGSQEARAGVLEPPETCIVGDKGTKVISVWLTTIQN
jgi:hypothetical protein